MKSARSNLRSNPLPRAGSKQLPDKKINDMFEGPSKKRESKTLANDIEFADNMFELTSESDVRMSMVESIEKV